MTKQPRRRLPFAALLALATIAVAGKLDALSYVSIEAGQILLGNPGAEGEASPVLLSTLGGAVPLIEVGHFRFELGALLWGTQYEYLESTRRLVPTQIETANQIQVLGLWVSPLAGANVRLAHDALELGAAGGLALNFRFAVHQTDVPSGGSATLLGEAYRYFFSARFLFPETRLWIKWFAYEDFALSLSLTALYPVFQIWDEGAFMDQFFFAVLAGFEIRPTRKKSPPAAGGGSAGSQAPAGGESR